MSSGEKTFPQYGPICVCCAPVPWWSPPDAAEACKDGPRRDAPRLLNSFTKTKVPFVPLDGNRVGWYICGPTVYDSAHMGHARNYVNFDVIRRVMTDYFRYDVRFIMNVTDIDDKIVMRAHLRRSEAMIAAAEDVGGLDALTAPLKALLASGEKNLGEQESLTASLCAAIVAKDPTAVADPDWTVQDGYLALAHAFEAEFMEDMRLMGVARPDALTRVSEYTEKIVQYIQTIIDRGYAYESNGSVYFDVPTFEQSPNHKYAKLNKEALKNFITIRAALKMYTARQIRFLFLLHQWSDPMDLTPVQEGDAVTGFQQMEAAVIAEKTFVEFFHSVKGALRGLGCAAGYSVDQEHTWGDEERALSAAIDAARAGVHAAMIDNINTPAVIKSLKELVGGVNKYLGSVAADAIRPLLVESAARYVTMILACLGVAETTGGIGLGDIAGGGGEGGGSDSKEEAMAPVLDLIVKFRDEIRALARSGADAKALMQACDRVRDVGLPELGVKLDDREGGALWKLSTPEELRREAQREAEAKAKKEEQKRREKEEAARKAAEKEALAKVPPNELFKQGEYAGLYSKYDKDGLPTHDKDGEELAKAQRKKLAKTQAAQKKEHDKFLAKAAADQLGKATI